MARAVMPVLLVGADADATLAWTRLSKPLCGTGSHARASRRRGRRRYTCLGEQEATPDALALAR
ncbi:MAG: hypothetical protein NZ874_04140 [Fimbriimonadales bacterium]|nr:hypothetical protein [Fimbriimonadales bacterium]